MWFCQILIDTTGNLQHAVTGKLALGSQSQLFGAKLGTFLAHWSDNNILTLAIDVDCFWKKPFGAKALSILVHEAGHARAMHHGKGFVDEIERLAGVVAQIMLEHRDQIVKRWPDLTGHLGSADSFAISAHQIAEAKPKRSWFMDLRRRT